MNTTNNISAGSTPGALPAVPTPAMPSTSPDMAVSQDLTAGQVQQWADTMSHMAWTAPGFRHLFFKLLATNNKAGQAPHVAVMDAAAGIAATDGANILINPDRFFKEFNIPERTFIMCHEVVHNVYDDVSLLRRCMSIGKVPMHDGTTMPFDEPSMQRAMDLRIDSLLIESRMGRAPKLSIDRLAEHQCNTAVTANESVLDIYKRVYEDHGGAGGNLGGFDNLLPAGNSAGGSGPAPHNTQQWAVEVSTAQTLEQIRSQGHMAGALQRMFKEILEPEIDWTDHIQGLVNRSIGSGNRDWRRPDRRFIGRDIYLPSASGFGCNWLVVGGDTSGSIGDKELCAYAAEIKGIIEDCKPKRLTVVWWDTKVQHVEELESAADLDNLSPKGGGGSNSKNFFKWIHDNGHEPPDMAIVFTDLCIGFPDKEPPMPVVWASVEKDGKAPFGEVVFINQKVKP